MEQKRIVSKPALIATFALIGFFLGNYGLYDVIGLTSETYQQMINLILALIGTLGVWNNPTSKDSF